MRRESEARFSISRRQALFGAAGAFAGFLPGCGGFEATFPPRLPSGLPSTTPWPEANAILAGVVVPVFPERVFSVADFGARADAQSDCTLAFARAVSACHAAGGGRVLVPAGEWSVGAIRLLSHVELHVARGAVLYFSEDERLFPAVLTRSDGVECVNRSPLIYAYREQNVAITGEGRLDAARTAAWNRGGYHSGAVEGMLALPPEKRIVRGKLRSTFIEPYGCRNVLIQGITLTGAQSWQLHPTLCRDVTIDGVTTSGAGFRVTDACDPESCDGVVIKNCTLASGDDNIALKSGRNADGRRVGVPCQNVVIINCQAEGPDSFLACGSESSGGIRNVYAFNNWSYGRGVKSMLHIKTNSDRGGVTSNINIDTFSGSHFNRAIVDISLDYDEVKGAFPPAVSAISIRHVRASDAQCILHLAGLPESPIRGVELRDCTFADVGKPIGKNEYATGVSWTAVTVDGRPFAG